MAKPPHDEILRELTRDVAILNERVNTLRDDVKELKRGLEEASKRRGSLVPPVVGALVSVLLGAYLVARH